MMKRIKNFLKVLLFFSLVSFFVHFYISFFSSELCSWNTGVVFGLVDFLDPFLLSAVLFFFLAFVIFTLWKSYKYYWELLAILALSSLGNIIDRVIFGGVCDYIHVKIFLNFPVFNLNDIFISIALFLILFIIFYETICCKKKTE